MIGWVILCTTRVELTEDTLRAQLDRIYPGEFLPSRQLGTFVVAGPVVSSQFLIKSAISGATGIFILQTVPRPYTAFSPFAKHMRDPALRRLAVAQRAWLGLELVGDGNEAEAYRFIGKVLGTLAPEDAAVLVHPSRFVAYPFDAETRRKLSNGELH
jgi:hypothetical protein